MVKVLKHRVKILIIMKCLLSANLQYIPELGALYKKKKRERERERERENKARAAQQQ